MGTCSGWMSNKGLPVAPHHRAPDQHIRSVWFSSTGMAFCLGNQNILVLSICMLSEMKCNPLIVRVTLTACWGGKEKIWMGDGVCAIRSTSHDGGGISWNRPGRCFGDVVSQSTYSDPSRCHHEGGCAALPPSPLMQSHHLPLSAPSSDRPRTHSSWKLTLGEWLVFSPASFPNSAGCMAGAEAAGEGCPRWQQGRVSRCTLGFRCHQASSSCTCALPTGGMPRCLCDLSIS